MKKQLIKLIFTALTFGTLVSLNTMATETETSSGTVQTETENEDETIKDNNIIINESGKISVVSDKSGLNGVNAIQFSLKVTPEEAAKISFDFNQNNDIKVYDFRYHEGTNIMNIYLADSKPIFSNSDSLEIGSVTAKNADGNNAVVKVEAVENSFKLVAQNNITQKEFSVTNEEQTGDNIVKLKKEYPTAYMITIPAGTDTLKENDSFTFSVDDILLEYGDRLKVSVESENNWTLMDKKYSENRTGIVYQMGYGNEKTEITDKSKTVLSVGGGAKSGEVTLTVLSVAKPKLAGTFADTLTFKIEIAP